jgi:hypothetical protein
MWVSRETGTGQSQCPRTEIVKKRNVHEEANAETWTPSKKHCETNDCWDYISDAIDVSKQLYADFNFSKIHLKSHLVETICGYIALQQYSAERHEQAHKMNPKNCWNPFNQNLKCLPQVITFQRPIVYFGARDLNLQALGQHRKNGSGAFNVPLSGTDVPNLLGSQSFAKPIFMGPQDRRDGKHPDSMIKDFRALLNNTQDTTHHVAI